MVYGLSLAQDKAITWTNASQLDVYEQTREEFQS